MNGSKMRRWLEQIFATQAEEISCSECLDLSSQCVDWEIAGQDGGKVLQQVKQHLQQCRACREEYETLLDLAHMENDSSIPSQDELRRFV